MISHTRVVRTPLLLLIGLLLATQPIVRAQSEGPVVAYAFSEGTGTTTADHSGNGNTGTLLEGPAWVAGHVGGGLDLTAAWNTRVGLPFSSTLQLTTAFTVEAWVYPITTAAPQTVWRQDHPEATAALELQDGRPSFTVPLSTGITGVYASTGIPLQTWTHLAVSYDGTVLRLYVNGTEVGARAATGTLTATLSSMQIGGVGGCVDEVRIYQRALSAAEAGLDMTTPVDVTAAFQITWHTPADGAVGVLTTPITAGFSRDATEATVNSSAFELRDSANAVVAATVSYDAATHRARLSPSSALEPLSDYTVRVVSGASGVTDLNGATLGHDVTWIFRTAAAATDPVVAYAFSEGTGTTTADFSGNGNAGTLLQGPAWVAGHVGGGLDLTSWWNARVGLPFSETLQPTTALTVEAWVFPITATGPQTVWRQDHPEDTAALELQDGRPAFRVPLSTGITGVYAPTGIPLQMWTHLAASYDGSMLRLYVNGTEVRATAATGTLTPSLMPMQIGGVGGIVDEVRIYRRALSAEDVSSDMTTPVDVSAPFQIMSYTPADGAIGVLTTPITATFSRPADAATVNSNTLVLRDPANAVVAATVSYDAATQRATLTPGSALAPLSNYAVRAVSGASGVTDTNGAILASDVTWSFRTAAAVTGPVAAYAFSEGTGTTTADFSGNGNTGTLLQGPAWVAGHVGGGLDLTPWWNARVGLPLSETLQLTTALTVEAWVYSITTTGPQTVWRQDHPEDTAALELQDSRPAFRVPLSTGITGVYATAGIPLQTWTHLAVSYDGTMLRLYVNGTEVRATAATGTLTAVTLPMQIGGFGGIVDEVRIYRRALSTSEINTDMNTAGSVKTSVGLTSPSPGTTLNAPSSLALAADVVSTVPVASVSFFAGATFIGSSTASPYHATWWTPGPGAYSLTAIATDDTGRTTVSPAVNITITGSHPISITSVSPQSGAAGAQVTISGSGFGSVRASGVVWLGSKYGTVATWSDTKIVATVAKGSRSGTIQVRQNGTVSNSLSFTVLHAGHHERDAHHRPGGHQGDHRRSRS